MTHNNLVENLGRRGEHIFLANVSKEENVLIKLKGNFGEALVITNKMLYVLKWGFMTGNTISSNCINFDFANITGLNIRKSLATGTFEILTPATQNVKKSYWGSGKNSALHSENIVTFPKKQFSKFEQALKVGKDIISKSKTSSETTNFDKLEKLAELQKKGIITRDEFEKKKKELLENIK